MEYKNAFLGRKEQPTADQVDAALADSAPLWHGYIEWLADKYAVKDLEWKSSRAKYGWSVRLKLKQRNIVYMAPADGCFQVSFALSDRAIDAAKKAALPASVHRTIAEAPKYAEGTGLRLIIRTKEDMPAIQKLAEIKLAN